jgi:hypothetical protein
MIRLLSAFALASTLSVLPIGAQSQPASGLYQIVSGIYTTCCGIAGASKFSLPNKDQAFFRLSVDPQSNLPRMTFLGQQMQTIFSVAVCAPNNPIDFNFGYGLVLPDSIVFHVDAGPAPEHLFWNYSVSNSAGGLRIDGMVGIDPGACSEDFMSWTPLSTNVMPNTDCPICPFITFRDNAATNLTRRFYRSFEIY